MAVIEFLVWAAMHEPSFPESVQFRFPFRFRAGTDSTRRWFGILIELERIGPVEVDYWVYQCYPNPNLEILKVIDLPF